ncbi:MAG TPA: type VI secretion system tip protein VgrG [Bacteroidetes bacterium]|nr:type VI secretion system tip protein VgrG [Bacteroidota bacterium]
MSLTAEIKNVTKGKRMSILYELMYIDVIKEANRIPLAELVVLDGDAATQKFEVSNEGFFDPGSEIRISLREDNSPMAQLFQGIVVKQTLKSSRKGSFLTIELVDKAYAMCTARKSMVFRKQDDSTVMRKLIKDNGLKAGKVFNTSFKHAELVQFQCTDWDFMLARADANGLLVLVDDGKVAVSLPNIAKAAKGTFEYGINEVYDLEIELDAREQVGKVSALGWDIKTQKLMPPQPGTEVKLAPGRLKGATLGKQLGALENVLVAATPGLPAEFKAWAKAKVIRSRLSMIRGRFNTVAQPKLKVGDIIEIKGISTVFNGKTMVTGIRHSISQGSWSTEVQFGLDAKPQLEKSQVSMPPSAGLLPAVNGLQVGIVQAFSADPDKQFRVKVKLPALNQKDGIIWARLSAFDAGKERGNFFRPEKGDEVIVGFFNDDPRQAVILGSMYSSKHPPFVPPEKMNKQKGLITRGKIGVLFDDNLQRLSLSTDLKKLEQLVIIDQKAESITLVDNVNKNIVQLGKKGVTITAEKDFNLKVKGNINLTAKGKVKIKGAKTDII